MRQITKDSVNAWLNGQEFNKQNMSVRVEPNVTVLELHGNAIAYKYNDPEQTVTITNAYWPTVTTRERLTGVINAVLDGRDSFVCQRKGKQYLTINGIEQEMADGKEYVLRGHIE